MDGIRKAIAIDFDGCLCTDAFPAIGDPNWSVINQAKAEQQAGTGLILWTCREDQLLLDAIAACEGWGLTFDSVNESLPDWIEAFKTQPRKVGASEYWDDKAILIPITSPPPNEPLTLAELRKMDGEPVWVEKHSRFDCAPHWALVHVHRGGNVYLTERNCGQILFVIGDSVYRRKPEEV